MTPQPWLATYGLHRIPRHVDPDAHPSVVHMLEAAMERFADLPAFHAFGQTLSYADVDRQSAAFAAWLQHRLGVKKGDRIAVMMPNFIAFPIAFLGIARAGAVQVNVNPLYTPRELEHQLNDSGSKIILVFTGATPALAEVVGNTGVQAVLTVAPGDGTPAALPTALREGAALARTPVALAGGDLLFLQYTGGTTGASKGACLSHRNLVANTGQFKAFMPDAVRPAQEVVVTAIPLYHIFALMVNFITYFSVGAENWLVANPRDVDGFVETMKQARPSVFTGVNTLYAGLTMHPRIGEVDFSRLRLAAGGGAAIIATTSARWQKITGCIIREGYGLSETSPVLTLNPAGVQDFNGTAGLPFPGTDIVLLRDDGSAAAPGESGEVCAKGPQVMQGYWNQPEANAAAFTADGYFRTGDIGQFTPEGFLKIVDRKKDMIIVSGFNVFPNEVEAVASACPGVAECACVGVPDEKTGEAVRLFVVRTPGAALDEAALVDFCRTEMAAYKVPRQVRFVDALPKSTVGKILRRELRDAALQAA